MRRLLLILSFLALQQGMGAKQYNANRTDFTTSALGGGLLAAGGCASTTISVTNAVAGMPVSVVPLTDPGVGFYWQAFVSSAGTVTVRVCTPIIGTPVASQYKGSVD